MAANPAAWRVPSDAAISGILVDRIDVERRAVGIVVGVIDGRGRRVVAHGAMARHGGPAPDGDTVFEIGSITKVFTSLVLAEMAGRGEVALDDPVVKYLPAGVAVPERGGRQITLIDLAMHTSGLPRRPSNMSSRDWSNPYADYTVDQLYAFLNGYRLRRNVGAAHLYSNLGAGLLGHVLSLRAGVDYETLIHRRITDPLGMTSTAIGLSPEMTARLAPGHDEILQPIGNWDLPSLAGAGALRSTTNDLLALLAAELGYVETPLAAAMAAQLKPRRPSDATYVQTLGWRIDAGPSDEIVWHGGATGGYRCFVLFDRALRAGVVVLNNSASPRNDDIGFHLLSGKPLLPPSGDRDSIHLPATALDGLIGRYGISDTISLSIAREGERLFAQLTDQAPSEIFLASQTEIFWRIADAQATIELGPDGRVTGLVLHQNGRDQVATRLREVMRPEVE